MRASDSDNDELYEQDQRRAVGREREVQLRESAVAAREAAADAREIALEMRETTVEIQASGISQRELHAYWREQHADEREVHADRREQRADEREDELSRLHPPTAEVAEQLGRETLGRALAQLRRAEDAVARGRSYLARTEHLAKQSATGKPEDPPGACR